MSWKHIFAVQKKNVMTIKPDKKYSMKRELGSVKWKLHCSDSLLRESYWKIKSLESEIRELKKSNEQLKQENEKYLGRGIERYVVKKTTLS